MQFVAALAPRRRARTDLHLAGGRPIASVLHGLDADGSPLRAGTLLLWAVPMLLAVAAIVAIVRLARARRQPASEALAPQERQRLRKLLDEGPEPTRE